MCIKCEPYNPVTLAVMMGSAAMLAGMTQAQREDMWYRYCPERVKTRANESKAKE